MKDAKEFSKYHFISQKFYHDYADFDTIVFRMFYDY